MKLNSPAKINLYLEVVARRPDGYHDLRMLMCSVGLFDTLRITFDPVGSEKSDIRVICDHPEVPCDDRNLIYRAAEAFFEAAGRKTPVSISLDKQIPVGAGLGGGSSNAATVLKGLNRHFDDILSVDDLRGIGARIGADVPFFIEDCPAFASGIGDRLAPCKNLKPYSVVLVNPGFHVSTGMVYKKLNLGLTKCKKKIRNFPFKEVSVDACRYLCNDLETVTESMFPEVISLKTELLDLGARGALMSGSGPTVFGLFSRVQDARQAYGKLEKSGHRHVFLTELLV